MKSKKTMEINNSEVLKTNGYGNNEKLKLVLETVPLGLENRR